MQNLCHIKLSENHESPNYSYGTGSICQAQNVSKNVKNMTISVNNQPTEFDGKSGVIYINTIITIYYG